jgi:SPP1 gp7 family putative phage head morphogenesis protein
MRPPTAVERRYRQILQRELARIKDTVLSVLSAETWRSLVRERRLDLGLDDVARDAWTDSVDRVIETLTLRLDTGQLNRSVYLEDIGQRTSRWNDEEWQRTMRAVAGVSIPLRESWLSNKLSEFVAENAALIKTQSQRIIDYVGASVRRGVASGRRHEELRDDLIKKFGVEERRAKLIARDQVAKLNGDLMELRQRNVGVEEYYWETSRDQRVRDSHKKLQGMLCRWDDDSVYSDDDGETWKSRDSIGAYVGRPAQDYQCRCWPRAKFS